MLTRGPLSGCSSPWRSTSRRYWRERAALVYLHSSRERQRALADAVGEAARAELAKSEKTKKAPPKGTRRARNRRPAAGGAV